MDTVIKFIKTEDDDDNRYLSMYKMLSLFNPNSLN